MTLPQCDGTEKHSHYKLSTGETHLHSHKHTQQLEDFNRLHHHTPLEHNDCTDEELTSDAEVYKVPF